MSIHSGSGPLPTFEGFLGTRQNTSESFREGDALQIDGAKVGAVLQALDHLAQPGIETLIMRAGAMSSIISHYTERGASKPKVTLAEAIGDLHEGEIDGAHYEALSKALKGKKLEIAADPSVAQAIIKLGAKIVK